MKFKSINPYTGEAIATYSADTSKVIQYKLRRSAKAWEHWRKAGVEQRCAVLWQVASLLESRRETLASLITMEMGKPITEARAEVDKCAWVCRYYSTEAPGQLAPELIRTEAAQSYVQHDPTGTILAIMPWNYPLWQVFRFAAPTLAAGNCALLKHATNVLGCARAIEEVFKDAGLEPGVFQNLFIDHRKIASVLKYPAVTGISLTGSEAAGRAVASLAGKHLLRSVLELGGSNAYVVLADADVATAAQTAVKARMMNSGQSCIAAKRFIIEKAIYADFMELFLKGIIELKSGNPLDDDTAIGPLARTDLAEKLEKQVRKSLRKGATLLLGGKRSDAYFEPTVLEKVKRTMPVFIEETFGPVAAVSACKNAAQAFKLAATSSYGLGISVFTSDEERAKSYAAEVADGAFFINELVKSDPRLPFGGERNSGYGRELSIDGIKAFVNRKTIFVK